MIAGKYLRHQCLSVYLWTMLTIRLQRTGKRNQADFRIVLAEKEAPVKKKHLEVLGSFNPRSKAFKVNDERVKYWISQRVEISPTVHNLFVTKGLVEGAKVKAFNTPKKAPEAAAPVAAPASATEILASPQASAEPVVEQVVASTSAEATADKSGGSEKSEKSDQTTEASKTE